MTITFSESLTAGSAAVASEFAVTHGAESITASSAEISGADLTLSLSEAVSDVDCSDDRVTVGYSPTSSSLVGINGGTVAAFTDQTVTNSTDAAPRIVSIESDAAGRYIYVTFCENIAAGQNGYLTINAFSVEINDQSESLNNVLIRPDTPSRLDIQLGKRDAIGEGDAVTVSYDRDDATDGDPPQDANQGGKQVESWHNRKVANNVDSPPELLSVAVLYDVVTLTFSEELDEGSVPDENAFTIGGVQHAPSVEDVSVSDDSVTLTLNGILHNRDSPTYTLSYIEPNHSPLRQLDGAHNVADIFSFQFMSSTPDKKPEVSKAEVDGSLLTITFDLPLKAVAPASAFTIAGADGISVTKTSFNGSTVTLTISPAATVDAALTVSYARPSSPPRIEARNNRDADAFSNQAVTNRTAAPAPAFSRAETSAAGRILSIDFTLPLDTAAEATPANSSFSLSGTTASVSTVSISGSTVTLGLQPLADVNQTITASYSPPDGDTEPKLRSLAHQKEVKAFNGQPVTNNTDGKPRPVSATVAADRIKMTFDRPLDGQTEPAPSAFAIGGVEATVSDLSIAGTILTLTVSREVTHLDDVTVGYTQPAESPLKRDGSTLLVDSFSGQVAMNDTEDPTPTFRSASVDAPGRTLTIVMSHALLATSAGTPAASTFTLSGSTTAEVASVAIDGSSIDLTLDPAADLNETVSVGYQPPSDATSSALQSPDGKWTTAAWTGQSVTNNADGVPRPFSATANGNAIGLTFDRDLDENSIPQPADFGVTPAEVSVDGVDINADTVALTLSAALEHDDEVTVSYLATGMVKLKRHGRPLNVASFDGFAVENETPEPLMRSIIGDKQSIVVTFTKSLGMNSTLDAFAFSLGADQPMVSSVTVNTMTIELILDRSLSEGVEYTLTYTPPSFSPLQTSEEEEIPGFSEPVTNNTDVGPRATSAVGEGSIVTIEFDQSLDANSALIAGAFTVNSDIETTATAVVYEDHGLQLTLSRPLMEEESVSIAYSRPSSGGIADATGNRTESFALDIDNQTDTAPVPISGTFEGNTITIVLDQELAAVSLFDLDQDDNSVVFDHFTLTGTHAEDTDIVRIVVSNGGPNDVGKIVITLSRQTREGEALTIRYFPTSGSIRIRDGDAGRNRAVIDHLQLTNLNDEPPVVESASVDGVQLLVTFDQQLDADSIPDGSTFSLAEDGPVITEASISGGVLTLTLATTAVEDAEYTLSYTPPETKPLLDLTGNEAAGFSVEIDNDTDYEPFPETIRTDTRGEHVVVTFDQRLAPLVEPDVTWFTLKSASGDLMIGSVDDPIGRDLRINLEQQTPVREGSTVMLQYEMPDSGGLQDPTGHLVQSFDESVANHVDIAPLLTEATVNRDIVTLTFDQHLNPDHVPLAHCEQLPTQAEREACDEDQDISWFRVLRGADEDLEIAAVQLAGTAVTIRLLEPISRSEKISLEYSRESLADGRYNLRDTSTPGHPVETFGPIRVTNLTAATALEVDFVRLEPDKVEVRFDGELSRTTADGQSLMAVFVDDKPADIESVRTDGSGVTLKLKHPVPECASVSLSYVPGETPLLDIDGREVVEFAFEVANLLDPQWGLSCVQSDVGALQLTFTDLSSLQQPGFEWQLVVNEQARAVDTLESEQGLLLRPAESICEGDLTIVRFLSDLESEQFQVERTIQVAAPCALSASADGVSLQLTFDNQLDGTMADLSHFAISGRATLEAVEGVEDRILKLRLTPPGLRVGEQAEVSYKGDSLISGELTVGPFVLPILDTTAPPGLESAFALNSSVFLTFDQPLIERAVPASRFIVSGPGIDARVTSVSLSGSSVYLELSDQLPDDPDLFGLVYLAGTRGGLAGLTGSRLPDSVFIVRNFTETPPTVLSAEADSAQITLTFDEEVEPAGALPSDFAVVAGHRPIAVESLRWLPDGTTLTLTLVERVTSLDAVVLRYVPVDDREIRDQSDQELEAFELRIENLTAAPSSIEERIADAELRASSGTTTFALELARGFASSEGVEARLDGGDGWTRIARGDLQVSVDVSRISDGAARIEVAEIDHHAKMLDRLDAIPFSCWNPNAAGQTTAWWIGTSDAHGVPADHRVRVTLLGAFDSFHTVGICVLDLIEGDWQLHPFGQTIVAPALVLIHETPVSLSWDHLPLAG